MARDGTRSGTFCSISYPTPPVGGTAQMDFLTTTSTARGCLVDSRRISMSVIVKKFCHQNYLFSFPSHSFISLFNLSVASLRVQPVHKDLCSQVFDSGETVPALKIQYQSFGRSGPDIWSTYTNPTMNSTTSILFIWSPILPPPSDRTEPISTSSLAVSENVLPSFKAPSGSSRPSNIAIRCKI